MRWLVGLGILFLVQDAHAQHLVSQKVIANSPYTTLAVSLISASLMKGKILEWGTGVVAGLSGIGVLGLFSKSFASAYSELRFLGSAAVGGLVGKMVGSIGGALRGLRDTGKKPTPDDSPPPSPPVNPVSRVHEKVPSTGPETASAHRPVDTKGTAGAVHRDKTSVIAQAMQELKNVEAKESGPAVSGVHGRRKVVKNVGGYNIAVEEPIRDTRKPTEGISGIHGGADGTKES